MASKQILRRATSALASYLGFTGTGAVGRFDDDAVIPTHEILGSLAVSELEYRVMSKELSVASSHTSSNLSPGATGFWDRIYTPGDPSGNADPVPLDDDAYILSFGANILGGVEAGAPSDFNVLLLSHATTTPSGPNAHATLFGAETGDLLHDRYMQNTVGLPGAFPLWYPGRKRRTQRLNLHISVQLDLAFGIVMRVVSGPPGILKPPGCA